MNPGPSTARNNRIRVRQRLNMPSIHRTPGERGPAPNLPFAQNATEVSEAGTDRPRLCSKVESFLGGAKEDHNRPGFGNATPRGQPGDSGASTGDGFADARSFRRRSIEIPPATCR